MKFSVVFKPLAAAVIALLACAAAPAQQTAAAPAESPEQAQIRSLESQWADALVKRDQYAADLVLAPTFVDISAHGEVTTKNQQIAKLFSAQYGVETYNETLTSVRVLGDTAIAQGTYTMRVHASGPEQEEKGIFTHVYQRTRQSWQCINSQRTIIIVRAAPPRTAAAKDKTGVLPFHVPLMPHRKNRDKNDPDSSVTAEDAQPVTAETPEAAPAAAAPDASAAPAAPAPTLEDPK